MQKFKPGELFEKFQAKKKAYEEKKKRKAMPTLRPISTATKSGLTAGVSPAFMGLPKPPKAPRVPKVKMKMCKEHGVKHTKSHHEKFHKGEAKPKHLKAHSEESIKALREFADDEAKEKGKKSKHMKHRKEHSEEEVKGLRKFVDEEAKEKSHRKHMKRRKSKKSFNTTTKKTGKFEGKSNALGHGGRAAQLRARGVPGGVIGAMARAAHAAPGQANYHGHKKHEKKCKLCGK